MESARAERHGEPAGLTFSGLVPMLGTTSLLPPAATPDPVSEDTTVNWPQVTHILELLDLLKAKTTGNRPVGESTLPDERLFDLPARYLEAVKRA